MADVKLKRVLEEVKALTPDEQWQLRKLLDKLLASSLANPTEDELEQKLVELGLLSEVKPPITDLTLYRNRKLIEVKGKPLSEIIIEERR